MDGTEFSATFAAKMVEYFVSSSSSMTSRAVNAIRFHLRDEISKYVDSLSSSYLYVRPFMFSPNEVRIDEAYSSLSVRYDGSKIPDEALFRRVVAGSKIMLFGTAGSGKSMLMKKLLFDIILDPDIKKVPIFIYLRDLEDNIPESMIFLCHEIISRFVPSTDLSITDGLAKSGKLVLILDGLDELTVQKRSLVHALLGAFTDQYGSVGIIITSRPDDSVGRWERFRAAHVAPLSKNETCGIISVTEYNKEKKKVFISAIRSGKLDAYKDLLSVPLLSIMMMMTYDDWGEAPPRIHLFYQFAYESLFQRHDASKSNFKRKTYSRLLLDQFQKVFSRFCAMTYARERFAFSDYEALDLLRIAISGEGLLCPPDEFLHDLTESVCLMKIDGMSIVFSHRSFQEYFTAFHIYRLSGQRLYDAIDAIIHRSGSDAVLSILLDMDRSKVEMGWLLPNVERFIAENHDALSFRNMFDIAEVRQQGIRGDFSSRKRNLMIIDIAEKFFGKVISVREFPQSESFLTDLRALARKDRAVRDFTRYLSGWENTYVKSGGIDDVIYSNFSVARMPGAVERLAGLDKWGEKILDELRTLHVELRDQAQRWDEDLKLIFDQPSQP